MGEQSKYEIEVFPKMDNWRWGLASSSSPLADDTKEKCAHWTVNLRFSSGEKETVHAYYHGDMPSEENLFSINKQIAEFFYGVVVADKK